MKYELAGTEFPTKQAASDYLANLLRSTPDGQAVNDPILYAALDRHPEVALKLNAHAIDYITAGRAGGHPTRCFWIVRSDGARVAFSYRVCLRPPSSWADLMVALRWEIRDQIREFRASAPQVCAITGASLGDERGEVDHGPVPTFAMLARWWVNDLEGGIDNIPTEQVTVGVRVITDVDQRLRWRGTHRKHARLRLLSTEAHKQVTWEGNK